jgi:hypothetical protein
MKNYLLALSVVVYGVSCTSGDTTTPTWLVTLLEYIVPSVGALLTGVIGILGTKLIQYLNSKIKTEGASQAFGIIDDMMRTTVQSIIHDYQDLLLESIKDGKIDAEEKKKLMTIAMDSIKKQVNDENIKKLMAGMNLTKDEAIKYLLDKISVMLGEKMGSLELFSLNKEEIMTYQPPATAAAVKRATKKRSAKK